MIKNILDVAVNFLPFAVAIISLAVAYFEWKKSEQQENFFRQQLIALLHHAEGVASSVKQITYSANSGEFSSVKDVSAAVNSAANNAEALFFGLIETKVGNVSLKNELDKKYTEWADLELERKKRPLRDFLDKRNGS
ncbi:MAG: hypothetical protein HGB08_01085 [Candidatus Moranbacteria bacterium]|nr:hypothetical protein [Candidatus Moranbacteria bacterium]